MLQSDLAAAASTDATARRTPSTEAAGLTRRMTRAMRTFDTNHRG